MAAHSSTLAWQIPWTEEPGRLQSIGLLRVGHDWATSILLFTFTFHFHAMEKEMATLQCSCLENPRDSRAWWAAVYGVAQSRTRLKWLSKKMKAITCITLNKIPIWNRTSKKHNQRLPSRKNHVFFRTLTNLSSKPRLKFNIGKRMEKRRTHPPHWDIWAWVPTSENQTNSI